MTSGAQKHKHDDIGELKVRDEINIKTLYKKYPPQFKNSNKAAVFKKCVNIPEILASSDADRIHITFARYEHGKSLPRTIANPSNFIDNNLILKPDIYSYTPTQHPSEIDNDKFGFFDFLFLIFLFFIFNFNFVC